jgi:hypothetical protein
LKPGKVILRMGEGMKENNGSDEPNWNTLYAYIEMSQWNLLYNCYVLIRKVLKKTSNCRPDFKL